ncbi:MAG: phage baseplate assembly protein V [Halobacteriota archaeon]
MSALEGMFANGEKERGLPGVAVGIVTNNADPDNLGRVKVTFPWRGANDESYWARVATLMAGNGRGTFFVPDVGDEVLVAFDNGDIHHPYVLGGLWNGKDVPPIKADSTNSVRMIRSRSGHIITMYDTTSEERIEIKSKSGHSIVLSDQSGSEKIAIKDKSGSNSIVIDSRQNKVVIESATQLSLSSPTIELTAQTALTIKSGGTLTLQGTLIRIN